MRRIANIVVVAALVVGCVMTANADVRLPALICDSMVLQQGTRAKIWGWADPDEAVTVAIGDQAITRKADNRGKWYVRLRPMTAGGPYTMTISGKNSIVIENVAVGEVWVCSGQSNMSMDVDKCINAEAEIASGDYPMLRCFTVKVKYTVEPLDDVEGDWKVATPETVGSFTAAGYFFARELHKRLGVPIGIIDSSLSGSGAIPWVRRAELAANPEFAPLLEQVESGVQHGAPKSTPICLYNAMIDPLTPYGVKGVIWYQGESDAHLAKRYRTLFPTLIQSWRNAWRNSEMPFIWVQLANIDTNRPWAFLREAQTLTLAMPHTAMATAIDIGMAKNIHPVNKQEVGRRLALAGLATVYGEKIEYSGPMVRRVSFDNGKAIVSFEHAESGLVTGDGGPVTGFELAGEDGKLVAASAEIVGNQVVVSSDSVKNPVSVRYAFTSNPVCNLYNEAGLPAVPFRTDGWPEPEWQ